jgi:hypothetical protein
MVLPSVRKWESRSALSAHLVARDALTVGLDAEAPRAYFSISVGYGARCVEVGVISSGFGTDPAVVVFAAGERALIGHDMRLTWITLQSCSVASTTRIAGVFYRFIPMDSSDEVVVIHELGALRVDANGKVIWSVDTDVVVDSRTDTHGNLILSIMDAGEEVAVSLDRGEVVTVSALNSR